MTVRQIIHEIEALPAEEQREIRDLLSQRDPETGTVQYADHAKAMAIADKIFTERAELFQKLAQ